MTANGPNEPQPAGATASIRFDMPRERHIRIRRIRPNMTPRSGGISRASRAGVWRVAVYAQVGIIR